MEMQWRTRGRRPGDAGTESTILMDAALIVILIFLLAGVLIGLGPRAVTPVEASRSRCPVRCAPGHAVCTSQGGTARPRRRSCPGRARGCVALPEARGRGHAGAPGAPRQRTAVCSLAYRGRNRIDDETWDDLEDTLLMADVGMPVTERILGDVKERARAERTATPTA